MLKDLKWEQSQLKPKRARLKRWQTTLLKAADLLEQKGWCQGRFHNRDGSYCAAGAIIHIARARYRGNDQCNIAWEAERALQLQVGKGVPAWNDNPRRTKSQVLKAMRAAAKVGE